MTHFFDKRDLWGNRFSLWIVVIMAFVAPLCWWSARQIRLDSDVEKWLPENEPERQAVRWTQEQFSVEDGILLTWDESSLNDPRIDKLVEQLEGKPELHGGKRGGVPYVSSVVEARRTLAVMQRNGVEPQEAVRRLEGTMVGAGPLRLKLTETGRSAMKKTKREIETAVRTKFGFKVAILDASPDLAPLVSIPAPVDENNAPGQPSSPAVMSVDGKLIENLNLEHDLQLVWKGLRVGSESTIAVMKWLTEYIPERGDGNPLVENGFFVLGSPIALEIGISEAGLADPSETLAAIRSACDLSGIPTESIHIAGNSVLATELNTEVLKAAWDTSFPLIKFHKRSVVLTSVLVCAIAAFVFLRSIRLSMMVVLISIFATACAMSIVPVTGGTMNLILIMLPTILVILTMSRAIPIANDWKQAACGDSSTAIAEAFRRQWLPCVIVCLTTVIGFISLCTCNLTPVREFGLFAIVGTIFSLFLVLFGLTSLMHLWSGQPAKVVALDHAGWRFFGRILSIRSGWQSLALIAICVGCGFGLTRLQTDTNVIRHFPVQARVTRDCWQIENSLAGTMSVETVIRFDQQSQKDTNFLHRMEIVRQIQEQMRVQSAISGCESLADFQTVSEPPAEDSSFVQRTKYNKRASGVQQKIRDGEIPKARSFYTVSEKGHDLIEPGDANLNQPGDELWRITARVNAMGDNDLAVVLSDLNRIVKDVLKLQPGSHHLITGQVPLFVKAQQEVSQNLTSGFRLSLAVMLGLFVLVLRNFVGGLVAMIPTVMPVAVVFGILSWANQRIDIGSIIAAAIVLGIAADHTLRYLMQLRLALRNGQTRHDAIVESLVQCGPMMWKTSAIVVVGSLALVPAELLLISRFGEVLAVMIGVGFLGDMVLLPQLVGGPLGRFFEHGKPVGVQSTFVQEPGIPVSNQTVASNSDVTAIPSPHIKPLVPASKKRRSSPRREPDAG